MSNFRTRPRNGVWKVLILFVLLLVASGATYYLTIVRPEKIARINKYVARHQAMQLKVAIRTFHAEYRSYPITVPPASEQHVIPSDHSLIDPLVASAQQSLPGALNPRQIGFLSIRKAVGSTSSGYRRGILYEADGGGELFDPWGNHYRVRLDLGQNGRTSDPLSPSPDQVNPQEILVWSAGVDGIDSTSDDITTW